jgi:hypothetical protein
MPFGISKIDRPPSKRISILIFVLATGLMFYLRLYLFRDRTITLTYGLPLLICLWHRDPRLLWSMVTAFVVMSTYKTFALLPHGRESWNVVQWIMQLINTFVIAGVVHIVMVLAERLHRRNRDLERANDELTAREEEITRQNEELQVQGEELAQQNEELQHQSEELQSQSGELQVQSEELQTANNELAEREAMLQKLLESLRVTGDNREVLESICRSALELLGGAANAAAVVEKNGDELLVRAQSGIPGSERPLPFARSFASVVITHSRSSPTAQRTGAGQ